VEPDLPGAPAFVPEIVVHAARDAGGGA